MKMHLLDEVNVVKSTVLKLSATTREREMFTTHLHPVLMSLDLCKLGVWNILVPNLQSHNVRRYMFI